MVQVERVRPVLLVPPKHNRPTNEPLRGYFEGAGAARGADAAHDL